MQEFDFSVVIPAYNSLSLLKRTLDSIRNQRDVSVQVVVVDDSNSNDDIQDYIEELADNRILYQHNVPSLGAVRNWNEGLRKCSGRYIVLVHHDEALQGDCHLLRLKKELETADVVVSNIMIGRSDGHAYRLYPSWFKRLVLHFPSLLFSINAIGPCAVVSFRKESMQMFCEQLKWFVDVEWYYRLFAASRVSYLPAVIVMSHHGHQEQISQTINIKAEAEKDLAVIHQRYSKCSAVSIASWIQIHILHNDGLHKILKKILGR